MLSFFSCLFFFYCTTYVEGLEAPGVGVGGHEQDNDALLLMRGVAKPRDGQCSKGGVQKAQPPLKLQQAGLPAFAGIDNNRVDDAAGRQEELMHRKVLQLASKIPDDHFRVREHVAQVNAPPGWIHGG